MWSVFALRPKLEQWNISVTFAFEKMNCFLWYSIAIVKKASPQLASAKNNEKCKNYANSQTRRSWMIICNFVFIWLCCYFSWKKYVYMENDAIFAFRSITKLFRTSANLMSHFKNPLLVSFHHNMMSVCIFISLLPIVLWSRVGHFRSHLPRSYKWNMLLQITQI